MALACLTRGVDKKRPNKRNKGGDRKFAYRWRVADLIHRRKEISGHALVAGRFVGGRTTSVPQTQRDKANPRGWQATSDHRHTNNSRERFYTLLLPLSSSLLLSFTFVAVDQPVVRRRQSIYRSSTETRCYVEHT